MELSAEDGRLDQVFGRESDAEVFGDPIEESAEPQGPVVVAIRVGLQCAQCGIEAVGVAPGAVFGTEAEQGC